MVEYCCSYLHCLYRNRKKATKFRRVLRWWHLTATNTWHSFSALAFCGLVRLRWRQYSTTLFYFVHIQSSNALIFCEECSIMSNKSYNEIFVICRNAFVNLIRRSQLDRSIWSGMCASLISVWSNFVGCLFSKRFVDSEASSRIMHWNHVCLFLCDCVNEGVPKAQLLASGVTWCLSLA